ncbi:MAG: energy-coupling factor transporter ATPase [Lachnospiraceae bacterium]|nr:energy-coupling factor transporter ATPase [Lachnospiraceae bacterium]
MDTEKKSRDLQECMVLDHVNYVYSAGTAYEKYALQDINLVLQKGEFIGLIGHTGSGKSTLVQQLNGLLSPTSGHIYFRGNDIGAAGFNKKELRSKVGLVFQYPEHQLFETTVVKDVAFGPKNMGLSQLEIDMRTFAALKEAGVSEDLYDASPFELSGGQKRRVAIAGVLAMQPDILILDEPTAGLDPKGRDEILDRIAQIHAEGDRTVILVSHSMEDVAKYASRLIVMNGGRVFCDGTPKEVFEEYRELEKIGLAAPQVTYLSEALRAEGIALPYNATTVDEARELLLADWRGGRG